MKLDNLLLKEELSLIENYLERKKREIRGTPYNFIDGGVIRVRSFLNNSQREESQR